MPEPSGEPERYTIDEMMGRLKGRDSPSKQSEVVTRSDGSQAIKLKKRRRRTNQPAKGATKRSLRVQIMQITGVVLVLILLGLGVGTAILYANSAGFREDLVSKLEISSGAEVKLDRFRMNPVEAHVNGVSLAWPAGNALDNLELSSVVAKITPSSFFAKTFGGDEIVAATGKLMLKAPDASSPALFLPPNPHGGLPVRFSRYSVPLLDISFGEAGSLTKAEASFYPSTITGNAEIRLRGGSIQFANWPPMDLDRAILKVSGSEFQVKSMRIHMQEVANRRSSGGYFDFSGTLSPLSSESPHVLSAKLETFLLPYLIGADLGRFFLGRVDTKEMPGSNILSFDPGFPEAARLELTVSNSINSRIDLAGFKFLHTLSNSLKDRWYEFPNFDDEVGIVVKRTGGRVELADINLVSRGRMALRGSISNGEGGKISGKLRIGIPETILSTASDKNLVKMFEQTLDGYRWVELEISGTSAVPQDDFRALYMAASATEGAAETGDEPAPKDSFEELIEKE